MKKLLLLVVGVLTGCTSFQTILAQEKIAEAIAETVETVEVRGTPVDKLKSNVRPLTVAVELTGNSGRLAGTLTESTQLSMKTSFGEAAIPMSEIAGVRFASGEDVSTTVIMLNGDSITGAIDIKQLSIETEWGTATIKGASIQSMLFVPNVQWQSTANVSGKRWNLVDIKPNPPVANTPASNPSRPESTPSRPMQRGMNFGQ